MANLSSLMFCLPAAIIFFAAGHAESGGAGLASHSQLHQLLRAAARRTGAELARHSRQRE